MYYRKTIDKIFEELRTGKQGLSSDEAKERLQKYGYNRIESSKKVSPLKLFLEQFNDPIVWVLVGALVLSIIVGYHEYTLGHGTLLKHATEPIVIGAIVIINAIIGFIQEYQAEQAIEALKKMASLKAVVLRDGEEIEIEAEEIVPGDILYLTPGEKIPADARLFEVTSLRTQEAALTGESLPVKKEVTTYKSKLSLGDRKNMVYSGTVITAGKAKAVVIGTGMETEIGHIAKLIETAQDNLTPLQIKLEKIGKFLMYLTLGICIVIFGVLFIRGQSIVDALITAVSLAVAAIPEGLPAVVTLSLALGVKRMIKKNALIRRLPSVETLGGTTVICTDKTGTLTKNEMTVKKVFVDGMKIDVSGSGYEPEGTFSDNPKDLSLLLKIGTLNNDAKLEKTEEGYRIIGDPTEGALIVSAEKGGFNQRRLKEEMPRTDEIMFDSKRKMMTTVHKDVVYVKGAPDVILSACTKIIKDGKVKKLSKKEKQEIITMNDEFSSEALRVLGFAYKPVDKKDLEKGLIFVGLQGMIDPPREEVRDAVQRCKTAGIRVIMITGDYKGTAHAIAKQLGIEGKVLTGAELEKVDLSKVVEDVGIFARVNPEHKMKIVDALQKKGHIVAMTGDGVNDAPALKESDIGIAMGITGTDVAKEASDMILTDDNFSSIVNAVEEGRGIYDNIKKFLQYLLSSNFGEVLVLFIATVFAGVLGFVENGRQVLPLLATQILWMNLVTDGLPAVALGVDPASKHIMERKPRDTEQGILTKAFAVKVFYTGILIAIGTLFVFWYYLNVANDSAAKAQTMAFTTLVLLQFVRIYIIRAEYDLGLFSNKSLIGAVIVSILLQMFVIYSPLSRVFETVALSGMDWLFISGVAVALLLVSTVMNKILPMLKIQGD